MYLNSFLTYIATLQPKPLLQGRVKKFIILVDPFSAIFTIYLVCPIYALWSRGFCLNIDAFSLSDVCGHVQAQDHCINVCQFLKSNVFNGFSLGRFLHLFTFFEKTSFLQERPFIIRVEITGLLFNMIFSSKNIETKNFTL